MGHFIYLLQIYLCAQATQAALITTDSASCNQSTVDTWEEQESKASAMQLLQVVHQRSPGKVALSQAQDQRLWPFDGLWPSSSSGTESDDEKTVEYLQIPEEDRVDKVSVEIYYETKCPFCIKFLNGTLREAWDDPDFINRTQLNLYPFGNAVFIPEADVSEGYHFWRPDATYPLLSCQHEESECFGNMVQACALDMYPQDKAIPYILCMSSYDTSYGFEKTSFECGEELGISMKLLKACVESERGSKLIEDIGDVTTKAFVAQNAAGVPLLVVQGERTDDQKFYETVCAWLKEPRPSTCSMYVQEETSDLSVGCGGTSNSSLC